jgi:hypothetical protein
MKKYKKIDWEKMCEIYDECALCKRQNEHRPDDPYKKCPIDDPSNCHIWASLEDVPEVCDHTFVRYHPPTGYTDGEICIKCGLHKWTESEEK